MKSKKSSLYQTDNPAKSETPAPIEKTFIMQEEMLKFAQNVTEYSRKEIDGIHKVIRWGIGVFGIIVLVGGFFTYKSIEDYKLDIKNSIRARVETEFEKSNLNKIIQEVAKEKIEEETTKLIIGEITESVKKEVKGTSDFVRTLLMAQYDDWRAYKELVPIANNDKDPFFHLARNAITQITGRYIYKPLENIVFPGVSLDKDIKKVSYDLLRETFLGYECIYQPYIAAQLLKRDDFTEKQKMSFCIDVFLSDQSRSLIAVCFAGNYFVKTAKDPKLSWTPFKTGPLLDWWKVNEAKFK